MRTNKILRWLYSLFMLMPLLSIGVTCLYVSFNKNAKDSYSDNTQYIQTDTINNDTNYLFNSSSLPYQTFDSGIVYYQNVTNIKTSDNNTYNALIDTTYTNFRVFASTSNKVMYLYKADNSSITISLTTNSVSFNFNLISFNPNNETQLKVLLYKIDTNTLDNAFYYATQQFIDSGFDEIDFVSFFDFLYDSPNIWTHFANSYINYALFTSMCFFLPSVLLWFVNFAYGLADGFNKKSKGY